MAVIWLEETSAGDTDLVGGKGASLGELTSAGLPVPPGFVVSGEAYRSFLEETGIDDELFEAVDVDADDTSALEEAADRAQSLILEAEFPDELRKEILAAYRDDLGEGTFVAVRSSATAEDLPDASFAGQQETFLNVTGDDLIEKVRECWASLFTQRAIYYRQNQGFDHRSVNIAVVVQKMVEADKSGVMFTSHPSTGTSEMIIEAAWGLGEAVVAGEVSPDNYVVDRETGDILDVSVATKEIMYVKDDETGETVERDVSDAKRTERVLSDDELENLRTLGQKVERHYNAPQDVEWAVSDGDIYMLQSRPITTIDDSADNSDSSELSDTIGDQSSNQNNSDQADSDDVLVTGLGSSPGKVSGQARVINSADELDKVESGDIIVTEMTTPDMVPAMKRAAGIVTDEGGMTSHASIVSRELGVPSVVGASTATTAIEDGQDITIDGDKGTVVAGTDTEEDQAEHDPVSEVQPDTPVKPMTATQVKVNVSIPEAAERAAATGADGVGLLRMEHMVLSLDKTPERYINDHGRDAYIDELVGGIRKVADEFYPRPVRVRTLDAPTDEFRELEGGDSEPVEHNPMLGYRGIRRALDQPEIFRAELEAFNRLYDMEYDNVEIMFPLVNDEKDVRQAKSLMEDVGIDPQERSWGVMIETPASALCIDEIAEVGIDFASFGTNDLTQYTLAVDRNNGAVADRFDEMHPAVLRLIEQAIKTCRKHDVDTGICGQAGSDPEMARFLVEKGVTSISANIDAVRDIQHEVKRIEQRMLLDSVRNDG
ncbi:phosphoenolpyruvate synthase [Salinarchaeum sp. IM2453]|uniref:phosphoenolpyruvate synthase n=1 Tax=Salinarchaeum sp. IM2453 TaxID=2862870 RepID=UPI001C840A22|nr:phosphoenolpyruvate synthase [Salinarchaeum sp. IM2453]QZA88756.1 phosphoenolpyruvate synthase [Salinarchaeum sp. IM2453]